MEDFRVHSIEELIIGGLDHNQLDSPVVETREKLTSGFVSRLAVGCCSVWIFRLPVPCLHRL
jgi:hypothetical protein